MQCPSCNNPHTRVLESRSTESGRTVRRRRECLDCFYRFTTYERIEPIPINVIKKDGTKQYYDRSKILRGIIRACEKTGIAYERLEAIVDQIEAQLEQRNKKEVSSQEIGDLVLHHLRSLSEVAYIRFASVYGQFTGIEDFVATLNDLRKQEKTEENGQYTALCLYKN